MAHFGSQTPTEQATIFPDTIRFNNAWVAFSLLAIGILIERYCICERTGTNMKFGKELKQMRFSWEKRKPQLQSNQTR